MTGFSICLASKESFMTSATHDSLLKVMLKQEPTYKCIKCAHCSGHPAFPDSSSPAHKLCFECYLDTSSSWQWWGGPKVCKQQSRWQIAFLLFFLRNWTDQQEKKAHEFFQDWRKQSKFYKKEKDTLVWVFESGFSWVLIPSRSC